MKKEKFFTVIASVLFCTGIFAFSIGVLTQQGINFYFDENLLQLGTVLIILGTLTFIFTGVLIYLNGKKEKQE